jgi:hypothetical protein
MYTLLIMNIFNERIEDAAPEITNNIEHYSLQELETALASNRVTMVEVIKDLNKILEKSTGHDDFHEDKLRLEEVRIKLTEEDTVLLTALTNKQEELANRFENKQNSEYSRRTEVNPYNAFLAEQAGMIASDKEGMVNGEIPFLLKKQAE